MKKIILFISIVMMTLIVCGCKKYDVTFIADGQVVDSFEYKKKADSVTEPAVPAKPGYTGTWSSYDLGSGDLTVNAIYTPITYTATFKADGVVVSKTTFTVETKTLNMPAVPTKAGYTGVWGSYTIGPNNMDINAVYTIADYKVEFKADNEIVKTEYYNINDKTITEPAVPEKAGYTGAWESYELTTGDKVVNAVYTPIGYTVTFKADGQIVETIPYDVTNKNITEPQVPNKNGYTGAWESYELTNGNIEVNAVYTVIEYDVVFKADGQIVDTLKYTVENKDITVPQVPNKNDYNGVWESYELTIGNIEVNAVYTPISYNVIFKADGEEVETLTYTVEDKEITEPAVPEKIGYTGAWESYTLTSGEVVVNAVYTHIPVNVEFVLNYPGSERVILPTVDGYITFVPERPGYEFNGWWLSSGSSADGYILSEKFDVSNVVLQSDLVLYAEWVVLPSDDRQLAAPSISINNNTFVWDEVADAQSYNIQVIDPNRDIIFEDSNYTQLSWELPAESAAGNYIIHIYANGDGYTTTNSPTVTKYYNHNFLGGVYGLSYDESTSLFSWERAENAVEYNVYVDGDLVDTVQDNVYDLSNYSAGGHYIIIEAIRENWISSSNSVFINKLHLLDPVLSLTFDQQNPGYVISWDEVVCANEYIIYLNGTEIARTAELMYRFDYNNVDINNLSTFEISVKAYDTTKNHLVSPGNEKLLINKYYILTLNIVNGSGTLKVNGQEINQLYVPSSEQVTISATPTKGFNFVSWTVNDNLLSESSEYSFAMPSNDYNVTAYFNYFMLSTRIDDYNAGTITHYSNEFVSVGDIVKLTATPNDKYEFVGWFIENECISTDQKFDYEMEAKDVLIEARFVSYKLTVTKNYQNAGTVSKYSGTIIARDQTVYLRATVNNGYVFEGWYFNGELYSTDLAIDFIMPAKDVLFEARYQELDITLHYIYNGEEVLAESYTNSSPITSSDFYRVDLEQDERFMGWYASPNFDSSHTPITTTLDLLVTDNHAYLYAGSYFGTEGFRLVYDEEVDKYSVFGVYEAKNTTQKLIVPGEFNGKVIYKAGAIGTHARKNNSRIVEVIFEYGIEVLARGALNTGDTLTKVVFPETLIEIGENALSENSKLTMVEIPDKVKTIGKNAFTGCTALEDVFFGDNSLLEEIGDYAFYNCHLLTQFDVPKTLVSFGSSAFSDNLESINYRGTIYDWMKITMNGGLYNPMHLAEKFYCKDENGNNSFPETIIIPSTIKEVAKAVFYGFEQIKTVILEEGVESIKYSAFEGCTNLVSVQLPNTLTEIDHRAFNKCESLKEIFIPAAVSKLGNGVFNYCSSLETVHFGNNSQLKELPNEFLYLCDNIQNVTIPDIDSLNSYVYNNNSYKNIYFQGSLEKLLSYQYSNLKYNPFRYSKHLYLFNGSTYDELTDLVIPETITVINDYALCGASGIKSIVFHENLESIGKYAFAYNGIEKLDIPASILSIGEFAFYNTGSLKELNIESYNTTNSNYIYYLVYNLSSIETLRVESGVISPASLSECTSLVNLTIEKLSGNTGSEEGFVGSLFSKSATDTTLYQKVTQQCSTNSGTKFTFYVPRTLRSVEILSGVIDSYAFDNFSMLTSIIIGENVTRINDNALRYCQNVSKLYFNATNAKLEKYALTLNGTKTYSVYIGDKVETIGDYFLFVDRIGDSYVSSVIIPENSILKTIGTQAFYNCYKLTAINIPNSVTSIGKEAFYNCSKITSINIPEGLTVIKESTFKNCSSLKEVVIPDSVTSIENYAFDSCKALSILTFGSNVKNIYSSVFTGCTAMNIINYKGTIEDWCNIVFTSTSSNPMSPGKVFRMMNSNGEFEEVSTIEIPSSVTKINNYQFYSFDNLESLVLHDQLTTINNSAFAYCNKLKSTYIYDSTLTIQDNTFYQCPNLMIYCEAASKPTGWGTNWNGNSSVIWGVDEIFNDNGYIYSIAGNEATLVVVPNDLNIIVPQYVNYNGTQIPVKYVHNNAIINNVDVQAITISNGILNLNTTVFKNNTKAVFFVEAGEKPESWTEGWNGTQKVYYGFNSNDYVVIDDTYYLLSENEARLIRYAGEETEYVFKDEIEYNGETYAVTSIELGAFQYNTSITKMTLKFVGESETTKTFFGHLFGATSAGYIVNNPKNIKEVVVVGTTKIDKSAFLSCSSIEKITLSDEISEIGERAFSGCTSLTEINIPNSLTMLNDNVFQSTALQTIFIPEQITYISSTAFMSISTVTRIEVDENNTVYDSRNNCNAIVETSTNTIIRGCKDTVYDSTITAIGQYGFNNIYKNSVDELEIPNTITSIGENAFSGITTIGKLVVPFVGQDKTGTYTSNLSSVYTSSLSYIFGGNTVAINEVVVTGDCILGKRAFYSFKNIKKIVFEGTVESIGDNAFNYCSALEEIVMPNGVKTIGNNAFDGCEVLKSIELADGLQTIGNNAFQNCKAIESIVIPNSVTSIGTHTFSSCEKLTSVVLPNTLKTIKTYMFAHCTSITTINLPETVTSIGQYAFKNCSSLIEIIIPANVTAINKYTFDGCSALTEIFIPNKVTTIYTYAFQNCTNLTKIYIPKSVTKIEGYIFKGAPNCTVYCEFTESEIPSNWHTSWDVNGKIVYGSTGF